jgi:hypothetical protein
MLAGWILFSTFLLCLVSWLEAWRELLAGWPGAGRSWAASGRSSHAAEVLYTVRYAEVFLCKRGLLYRALVLATW